MHARVRKWLLPIQIVSAAAAAHQELEPNLRVYAGPHDPWVPYAVPFGGAGAGHVVGPNGVWQSALEYRDVVVV